jgi:hypothetical protein
MPGAGADVGEAERLEQLADRSLVIRDPEALADDTLQVDPAPADDPVHGPVRPGLDEVGDLGPLLGREARLRTFRPAVPKPVGAVGVEAVNPVAQRLPAHATGCQKPSRGLTAKAMAPMLPRLRAAKGKTRLQPFLYRYRNPVERFFNKLKHLRAVATRSIIGTNWNRPPTTG